MGPELEALSRLDGGLMDAGMHELVMELLPSHEAVDAEWGALNSKLSIYKVYDRIPLLEIFELGPGYRDHFETHMCERRSSSRVGVCSAQFTWIDFRVVVESGALDFHGATGSNSRALRPKYVDDARFVAQGRRRHIIESDTAIKLGRGQPFLPEAPVGPHENRADRLGGRARSLDNVSKGLSKALDAGCLSIVLGACYERINCAKWRTFPQRCAFAVSSDAGCPGVFHAGKIAPHPVGVKKCRNVGYANGF